LNDCGKYPHLIKVILKISILTYLLIIISSCNPFWKEKVSPEVGSNESDAEAVVTGTWDFSA
jgi:hypothetical protein